jgi:hypothetical protein
MRLNDAKRTKALKRKRDEEENARVYDEFIASFESSSSSNQGGMTFVRGGVFEPSSMSTKTSSGVYRMEVRFMDV